MAPSTFASAAAGNVSSSQRDNPSDWYVLSRARGRDLHVPKHATHYAHKRRTIDFHAIRVPDFMLTRSFNRSRRTNGATQTFRRPSGAATTPSAAHSTDPLAHQQPPRYVPPHRNGTVVDTRYTKDQMLDLFKAQQSVDGGLSDGLPDLFVGGWQPDVPNGTSASWGRTEHHRDTQPGPDICWNRDGTNEPMGLIEMDDEEREVCSRSLCANTKSGFRRLTRSSDVLCVGQHAYQAAHNQQGEFASQWSAWSKSVNF